ncbi:hypothetical protein SORBI_3009G082800 [Sorghum bicolor]|uniref:Uncharacterized protein n=1 Tax=Sorghum bicolor TaxID=4558 RepID=A0A1B6P7D6_SORBI|nr:hypothetical protein SORBI_3009G082800 [Sorghum bicolor]OQU77641.1 hypothetical protein SORBI_3009G082800 [Sorghum bicolor]OQU77645.1 hypothetical protein SORBI_3009G082800 [Sorghum bicolor]
MVTAYHHWSCLTKRQRLPHLATGAISLPPSGALSLPPGGAVLHPGGQRPTPCARRKNGFYSLSYSCSWPSGSAAQGVGGIHQATVSGRVEGYRRRNVAGQNGEEADELVVQGHDAHNALLRTEVALLG